MHPYGYFECVTPPAPGQESVLESYTIVLADENDANRMMMPRIGNGDSNDCPGYKFPDGVIVRAAIYADDNQVYGMRLQTYAGVADIGVLDGVPSLYDFNPTSQFIGFFGTKTADKITSLGFLTHDPECVYVAPPEPEPEPVIEEIIEEVV